jgi:hypothetical protein
MTHDKLRDYIDKFDAAGMVKEPTVAAIRAVVELHKVQECDCDCTRTHEPICDECIEDYPCPTIQAIEREIK